MKIDKCPICREDIFYRIHRINKRLMERILNKYGDFVKDYGGIIDLTFDRNGRMYLAFCSIDFHIRNSFYRIAISLP